MRLAVELDKPRDAAAIAMPHAAMGLGSAPGCVLHPSRRMVSRLVVEEQAGAFALYRLDDSGGFVLDSWHDSLEDVLGQVTGEFGAAPARALLAQATKETEHGV